MIGYTTIGVSDMDSACEFYGPLLAELGATQLIGICVPYNEEAPHSGNGNMIAIPGGDRAGVDRLYAKAMELGATDDGAPGERLPIFYGAYVRDADGNKLCFYEMKM